jgi:diguanylate cyclase (GGDEF)-like protein
MTHDCATQNDRSPACKGNLLIVDDTADNLVALSGILTQKGYETRTVINGRMALMVAETAPPELILLDVCMADIDGYEVCQALKANPVTREIPIIFLSALDDIHFKVKAFEVGGVDYIPKPFHEAEVLARVETHLSLRRLQQQLQAANQELLRLARELLRLANLDSLTHLANRRCFDQHFGQEWRRLAREQQPLALIICDIDYFKQYNDTYGHLAGDACLRQVSDILQACIQRPADLVVRYGGEEFAILLPNTTTIGAIHIAQQIQTEIHKLQTAHAGSTISAYLTVSQGIATLIPDLEIDPNFLIAAADQALYRAKQAGRDRFMVDSSSVEHVSASKSSANKSSANKSSAETENTT